MRATYHLFAFGITPVKRGKTVLHKQCTTPYNHPTDVDFFLVLSTEKIVTTETNPAATCETGMRGGCIRRLEQRATSLVMRIISLVVCVIIKQNAFTDNQDKS